MAKDPGLGDLLRGKVIPSGSQRGVQFRLMDPLGEGGMGLAFYATREAPGGTTPAVLKVVRPEIVNTAGSTATLMIQKEAVALSRLNERVPPTPFVVRFLDTGVTVLPNTRTELPWIALEYVHGGAEGTTLEQRVDYSVKNTRFGFDPSRAAHTVECIAEGLTAIHEVGVVHRDLTPGNILCCGFGSSEVPKIADFGIARPTGIHATFGSVLLGTPGYAAPEQSFSGDGDVGPWTDVFSFACLIYFLLTGEQYFDTSNFGQALIMIRDPKRRSLLDAVALAPELRDNPAACRELDLILARATALAPAERPPTARVLASSILPLLRFSSGPKSQRASNRLVASIVARPAAKTHSGLRWTVRHPPGGTRLVRSVAWDGDGHCFAVTTEGLNFWNGTAWLAARIDAAFNGILNSVALIRPGLWLLGGEGGMMFLVGSDGAPRVIRGPSHVGFITADGDPTDLALAVGHQEGVPPLLFSLAAEHFFRPTSFDAARSVAAIARLDDTRWLLAGRTVQNTGFLAIYSPLFFESALLPVPPTEAFITCASNQDRSLGVAAGRRGVVARFDGRRTDASVVPGAHDLASAAVDVHGRAWVGGTGRLWTQGAEPGAPWTLAWEDRSWTTPFVSLRADLGVVSAMTVDGAVLEGRMGS